MITSLGHLIKGAIDNMACFSRSGGEGGGSSGRRRAARWVVWWGGGRRDVSVVIALALSGADSS